MKEELAKLMLVSKHLEPSLKYPFRAVNGKPCLLSWLGWNLLKCMLQPIKFNYLINDKIIMFSKMTAEITVGAFGALNTILLFV